MKRSGFTMIELIFVIVILGILAAVAIPKLASVKDDAAMANAAQSYCSDAVRSKLGTISELKGDLNATDISDIVPTKDNFSVVNIPADQTYTAASLTPTVSNSTQNIYVYYVEGNDTEPTGCFVSNADGTDVKLSGAEALAQNTKESAIIYK